MFHPTVFDSFFQGGFECASHRRTDGRRLDLIEATGHERAAAADYEGLVAHGLRTVRDGIRWHRVEIAPGRYDWSSFLPMLDAARQAGVQVIWDLCHYGWPDGLDIWRPAFVDRFARFAGAAAALVRDSSDAIPFYCPINEPSYWAWAGGDMARINPGARGRGGELKRQLTRAALAAGEAIRSADPRARLVHVDPLIHVAPRPDRPQDAEAAEFYRRCQYEAWDMLAGDMEPGLGGTPDALDIIGVNYYADNQWYLNGATIPPGDPDYRPLRALLAEIAARYCRPLLIAETGAEGDARASWLRMVAGEVGAALDAGLPVEGVCLYPVLDYPGWANDRHCPTGLYGYLDRHGRRPVHVPLAEELTVQQAVYASRLVAAAVPAAAAAV